MERFYHCACYKSKDEKLIPRIKMAKYMRKMSKEYPSDTHLENNFKEYYKSICNNIRKSWNIEGIVAVIYYEKEESVFVYEFSIKADNAIFVPTIKWDDEIERYYIEM